MCRSVGSRIQEQLIFNCIDLLVLEFRSLATYFCPGPFLLERPVPLYRLVGSLIQEQLIFAPFFSNGPANQSRAGPSCDADSELSLNFNLKFKYNASELRCDGRRRHRDGHGDSPARSGGEPAEAAGPRKSLPLHRQGLGLTLSLACSGCHMSGRASGPSGPM